MEQTFFMPVKVIAAEGAIARNAEEFTKLGRRALIVTGKTSAKKCGALDDVTSVLEAAGISYVIYDEITQNPMLSACKKGGDIARQEKVDFIIGIGGGSPLDATKAIAIFAANDMPEEEIFALSWPNHALPYILVGTTAGTGSEVTPYAVLTVDRTGLKRSVGHPQCYANAAISDPRYTDSLPREFTLSTALDALSHSIEGYFASTANGFSDLFAAEAICIIYHTLYPIVYDHRELSPADRDQLYLASLYAGVTIAKTGTSYCHSVGYFLTEDYHIPHGYACAVYLPDYLMRGAAYLPEKAQALFGRLGASAEGLAKLIQDATPAMNLLLSDAQIEALSARWAGNPASLAKAPGNFTVEDAKALVRKLFQ